MAGVWVLAENRDLTIELLNIGRDLADKVSARLTAFLPGDRDRGQEYIDCGADEVLVLPALNPEQTVDAYIPVIVDEGRREQPDIFLLSGTLRGRELAARIAARLDTGLCSQCTALNIDEKTGLLVMERLIFGGAGIQKVVCQTRPQMATIAPRTFEPARRQNREGKIRELPASPESAVKILERKPKDRAAGSITEAKVIICAGRGIEKQEDLALVNKLAAATGGEIGCTRPIAEELHWMPEDTCIGLSGKQVKPELYIGVGISGQIQHITGIRDAKVICAVNNDDQAPIFDAADYGIVGNLYEVLPELTRQLEKITNK